MDELLLPGESICRINEDLKIIQKNDGLKFGTDSYLLSAFIKKNYKGAAADLGAGTGIVSLFVAARCSYRIIHAVEIQPEFADLISRNAELNGLSGSIVTRYEDVRCLKSFYEPESFVEVFSNPPYMKCGSGKTSKTDAMETARRENCGTIDDFTKAASYLLKFGGLFHVVYRPERAAELICSLSANGLEPKRLVLVYPDAASAPCLVLIEAKKGASPSLKTARPLIIYSDTKENKDRTYTEDMERVYREFSLDFLFDK